MILSALRLLLPPLVRRLVIFNTALLNLVMKDQFSGTPNEVAASNLNAFVELCDMQKKKDVDNDVVKMK